MNRLMLAKELVGMAKELTAQQKQFNTQMNVGRAKYVVNHHDGEKTHPDGSQFFDIAIFSDKRSFERFVAQLKKDGYKES